uniref:Uncharacterized protein n=1 Tax=Setaria italica TaxID=4555 RepID=K3YX21_SETIT
MSHVTVHINLQNYIVDSDNIETTLCLEKRCAYSFIAKAVRIGAAVCYFCPVQSSLLIQKPWHILCLNHGLGYFILFSRKGGFIDVIWEEFASTCCSSS